MSRRNPLGHVCSYCGREADPRLGGRPKCMWCMCLLLGGGTITVIFIVAKCSGV